MGKFKEVVRALLSFSERERRGILWFIPLMIIVSFLAAHMGRPRFDAGLRLAADMAVAGYDDAGRLTAGEAGLDTVAVGVSAPHASPSLFPFDPNTASYRDLRALGFTSKAAAGIIRYRKGGKVFRIKEDFATCWDVGDSIFYALEPYIVIGPRFAFEKREREAVAPQAGYDSRVRRDSLFAFDPNGLDAEGFRALGFSARQAESIVERREQLRGFRSVAEFAECYVVGPEMFRRLEPYIALVPAERAKKHAPVELNTADSAALEALGGIGALTAGRIVALRESLGGFARASQLTAVQGMTETNYERILQQICVDSTKIRKIDINFAAPEAMAPHPYIPALVLRKIVKNRQLKGGWNSPEEMIKDGTLTAREAALLGPYLEFNSFNR